MQTFLYIIKTLYKNKWIVLLVPFFIALAVYIFLSGQPRKYQSSTTVYTGIVSGYNAFSSEGVQDWMSVNNSIDNLINIIKAESTLESVSLRLLARNLSHCNPKEDTEYMTSFSSIELLNETPAEVLALVIDGDEDSTYTRLREFYEKDNTNYLKQLFNWEHHYYSFKALSSVEVSRISNSDMLKISYINDDKYIVYNTLLLIEKEFVDQYLTIRYEQTNDVVSYFENELRIIGADLRSKEDNLTTYNVQKGIINYQEQTRMVAERARDIDEAYESVMREYEGAKQKIALLEEQMGFAAAIYQRNAEFIKQLNTITNLYSQSSSAEDNSKKEEIANLIDDETEKLRKVSIDMAQKRYSKEGLANDEIITEWLDALLIKTRTEQELNVLVQSKQDINNEFKRFSPVGSSIKRQDREINFSEQNYLSNLQGLNEAKLRQKNLQLTSATFRIITPPTVAIKPEKTKNTLFTIATFIFVLIIIMVYSVVVELFNRVPYDQQAAKKIIGLPVLGAIPNINQKSKALEIGKALSYNQLGNAAVNFFDRTKTANIINVISIDSGEGKSVVCDALMQHFEKIDTKPVLITHGKDFEDDDKYYLMAGSIYDFGVNENNFDTLPEANVIIVEYPPVSTSSFPIKLLDSSSITILVADSTKAWTDMNNIVLRQLTLNDRNHKLVTVLNKADNDCVGTFTGMLPPYTLRHRIHYTMWNLGNNTFNDEQRS
ncbi:MAG: Wzz/FepE/Etk N-terminal domain-containing protein [Bacteroidaceae bacterium]|nr:Wzz/FepE/Etk N-terminal domain-containing protein [Bacteroidaceae bacterium]